jgi:hypothetical protein
MRIFACLRDPIGVIREKGVNHGYIEPTAISRDFD